MSPSATSRRTPYTAKFTARGPAVEGSTGWWGRLRDPFSPEFAENMRKSAAEAAARSGDDPWCIGWFVDNELSWGSDNREIGTHWFQWMDQALTGRPDGENYQIGFVTVADAPSPELVQAARDMSATMYPRRFENK